MSATRVASYSPLRAQRSSRLASATISAAGACTRKATAAAPRAAGAHGPLQWRRRSLSLQGRWRGLPLCCNRRLAAAPKQQAAEVAAHPVQHAAAEKVMVGSVRTPFPSVLRLDACWQGVGRRTQIHYTAFRPAVRYCGVAGHLFGLVVFKGRDGFTRWRGWSGWQVLMQWQVFCMRVHARSTSPIEEIVLRHRQQL